MAATGGFWRVGVDCTKGRGWLLWSSDARLGESAELANPTAEETAFWAILINLGIEHIREKIVLNGDRFILWDFWLPKWNLVVELDGFQHERQKRYHHERSMWLARAHVMMVMDFTTPRLRTGPPSYE
jgi:very-short-patch-repair endonuclease